MLARTPRTTEKAGSLLPSALRPLPSPASVARVPRSHGPGSDLACLWAVEEREGTLAKRTLPSFPPTPPKGRRGAPHSPKLCGWEGEGPLSVRERWYRREHGRSGGGGGESLSSSLTELPGSSPSCPGLRAKHPQSVRKTESERGKQALVQVDSPHPGPPVLLEPRGQAEGPPPAAAPAACSAQAEGASLPTRASGEQGSYPVQTPVPLLHVSPYAPASPPRSRVWLEGRSAAEAVGPLCERARGLASTSRAGCSVVPGLLARSCVPNLGSQLRRGGEKP